MAKKRRESGWFDRISLAQFFDVAPQKFDEHIRPLFPRDATRRRGRIVEFYGRACVDAWAQWTYGPQDGSGDRSRPERPVDEVREERAKMLRMEREEREGKLIRVDDIRAIFDLYAARCRSALDRIERQHGRGPVLIFNETMEETVAEFRRLYAASAEKTG